jgi:hypothetical protein
LLRSPHRLFAAAAVIVLLAASAVPVLAADEPILRGVLVTDDGKPFAVEDAQLTLIAPGDSGIIAEKFEVADDGTFEVVLMPWGTFDAPAEVRLSVTGVVTTVVLDDDGCSQQYAPVAGSTFTVALEGGGDPDPIELVAEEQLIATVCGGLATPAAPTLPPTDTLARDSNPNPGGQVGLVLALGLLAFIVLLSPIGNGRRFKTRRVAKP